jgi:hypothetical protein
VSTIDRTAGVDRDTATRWYQGRLDAWNSHDPEQIRPLVTEDFALDTPPPQCR